MKRFVAVCLLFTATLYADATFHQVWQDISFRGQPIPGVRNQAQSVVIHRGKVIAGELLGRPDSFVNDVVVKAFHAGTGDLLWSDEFEGNGVMVTAAQDMAVAVTILTGA